MKLIYSKSIGLLLVIFVYSNCEQIAEKVPVSEVTASNLTSTPIKKSPITKPVKFKNKDDELRYLIARLEEEEWTGPHNVTSPISWDFNFTEPMRKIIDIGKPAQNELLKNIDNPKIKGQIMILLGGVGDEKAIEPMINAMIAKEEIESTPDAGKINLSANIALANITAISGTWLYGDFGEPKPSPYSKNLWEYWWQIIKDTFTAEQTPQRRHYRDYPNYGIYNRNYVKATAKRFEMNEEILAKRVKAKKQYGKLFDAVSEILFRYDPAEINFDFNTDEYEPEAETILPHLKYCHTAEDVLTVVRKELRKWFGEETAAREQNEQIAKEIWKLWQNRDVI